MAAFTSHLQITEVSGHNLPRSHQWFSGSLDDRVMMVSSDPISEGHPARRTRNGTCDARLYLVNSPYFRTLEAFFGAIRSAGEPRNAKIILSTEDAERT